MTVPRVLFDQSSPYRSRRLVIEYDGTTTAAYLLDDRGEVVVPVWLANHRPAPSDGEAARRWSGEAPAMPAEHTRHPGGRPPLDTTRLEVVWFEEGDGVAVLEEGALLAVVPGWADASAGEPGYARDALGDTPFARELAPMEKRFAERVERSRAFWRWRRHPDSWPQVQVSVLRHLEEHVIGPSGRYWEAGTEQPPRVAVTERRAAPWRPYTVLSTVGMCAQRMPAVERYHDDVRPHARVELALATTQPSENALQVFLWLAKYPWRAVTWFGPGHRVKWYLDPSSFPLGSGYAGVLMLDDPSMLAGPEVPETAGFEVAGDPVRWLWLVPVTQADRELAREAGAAELTRRLAEQGRGWVVT
ncbi:suppressor of fused domain protein [Allonocardiopsis opalescens]|uniref:Suppressor of fused protein SUFU n=1 Tax=Allonocardiopsis opalescens TaxID=1144618 RepID=A0A2T0PVH2_9ACTN|nr:suppressor of fused domain protein [Allonocardiopsis opalescens]PRX95533.1 suppressor of fused protein SUFU [Allonocardiopsis opalescens]